jgi:DNA invertase Pin-like site-specific DNA recombinase
MKPNSTGRVTNRTDGNGKKAPKAVVGYARVSTQGQAAEGISLDAQKARVEAYAASGGLEVAGVYVDAGISGAHASNRPALQEALSDVCRRKGVLVVYSLSRLARSTRDVLDIAARIEKSGADLVSLSEAIDTTSAAGKMVFRMLAVLAEFERDLGALAHLRGQGRRISGKIPFGFDLEGDRLIPNAEEQSALDRIQALRAEGRSLRGIAAELERQGIPTKSGGSTWAPKVLSGVIRREAVAA